VVVDVVTQLRNPPDAVVQTKSENRKRGSVNTASFPRSNFLVLYRTRLVVNSDSSPHIGRRIYTYSVVKAV